VATFVVSCGAIGCATTLPSKEPLVKKLNIKGNHALSDGAIEEKILTTKTGWWPFARKSRFDPVVWSTDLDRIKRLYGSRGYYQAEVVHAQATPHPPQGVDLEVAVREGEPTRVGSLDIEGLDALPERRRAALVVKLPLAEGRVFEEKDWKTAKELLVRLLRNEGYPQVVVDGIALVGLHDQRATLRLKVRLGARYRFGDIQIDTGDGTAIRPRWIWEQVRLAIADGESFSDDALIEAQRRVQNMGVFAAVKVEAGTPDPATQRIPVRVETREAPLHTLELGGGIRFDQIRNEARLIAEWSNRNFRGAMRRLTARAEAGWAFIPNTYAVVTNDQSTDLRNGPIARLQLEFEQPNFLEHPSLRERSSIGLTRTLEQTYDDLGGQVANGVIWQPRATLSIYPSHHLEGDQLNGPPGAGVLTAPLTLGCHTGGSSCFVWLSYLEEVGVWDHRDDALEPHDGFYVSLSLQEGGGPLMGDFSYFRVLPEARGYASLGDDRQLTFAARLKVGDLLPSSGNAQDSAVVTRFYGGGAQSMRGFNDRRLSPLLVSQLPASPGNPNPPIVTLPIGGNGLIDGSFEVRFGLASNLILAAFFDVGQVREGPSASCVCVPWRSTGLGTSMHARFDTPTAWPITSVHEPLTLDLVVPETAIGPVLSALHAGPPRPIAGQLALALHLSGDAAAPALRLDATGRALVVDGQPIGDVALHVRGDPATPLSLVVAFGAEATSPAPAGAPTVLSPAPPGAVSEPRAPPLTGAGAGRSVPAPARTRIASGSLSEQTGLTLASVAAHPPTTRELAHAHLEVSGALRDVSLAALSRLAGAPAPWKGVAALRVSASGTALAPEGALALQVSGATGPRFPATDARLDARIGAHETRIALRVARAGRPLAWTSVIWGLPAAGLLAGLADRAAILRAPLEPVRRTCCGRGTTAMSVTTGPGGYQFHRDHRDPGPAPRTRGPRIGGVSVTGTPVQIGAA
jgi:translocation and assembly module TamA